MKCPHCRGTGEIPEERPFLTGEDVVAYYYQRRAVGDKVTMKQLAEQYGFNPDYLSQVKTAYDKKPR